MPLGTSLKDDIESLSEEPADSAAECAASWAEALGAYVLGIVPASLPVAQEGAKAALQGALTGAFSAAPGSGIALMETAFLQFATAIGAGMAPAFVATPPIGPVGFASLTTATDKASVAATNLAALIDPWFRTGQAVPLAGGPAIPWS